MKQSPSNSTAYLAIFIALVFTLQIPNIGTTPHIPNPDENGKMFEGDVNMGKGEVTKLGSGSILTHEIKLWHHRTIPYAISPSFDAPKTRVVLNAMAEISRETCIIFKPRTNERDYIYIQLGRTCVSNVGRNGGKQNITLKASVSPRSNCVVHGEVLHELMHAIGFWHEQSRPDRDNFVEIRYRSIKKSASKSNFNKHADMRDLHVPYDYSSVMHYSRDAFQKFPSSITIIPLIKGAPIGIRSHLSHFDKVKINALYKCEGLRQSVDVHE